MPVHKVPPMESSEFAVCIRSNQSQVWPCHLPVDCLDGRSGGRWTTYYSSVQKESQEDQRSFCRIEMRMCLFLLAGSCWNWFALKLNRMFKMSFRLATPKVFLRAFLRFMMLYVVSHFHELYVAGIYIYTHTYTSFSNDSLRLNTYNG